MATNVQEKKRDSASAVAAEDELQKDLQFLLQTDEMKKWKGGKKTLDESILELRTERANLMNQKGEMTRVLRNSEKRRARLKRKSHELSTNDLVEVFHLRVKEKEKKTKTKA